VTHRRSSPPGPARARRRWCAVAASLDAAPGTPLASVPGRALVSNGNFHPVVLAIAYDALRIALCGPWGWWLWDLSDLRRDPRDLRVCLEPPTARRAPSTP
jgi:hypothetical protein